MNLSALQNSSFLQSLGWAIANSLWQAAVLWIACQIINGAYKNASAKFKNNLSTILLSSVFVWFCFTLFSKYFAVENLPFKYANAVYHINNVDNTSKYNWHEFIDKFTGVLPYLSVAYLLLLVFLLLRLINVYRFTHFIKFHGLQKPDADWKIFTERVARHMGITRKIKLWVSQHIDVPATIGFIKPVILIPLASINKLSPDQLEAIILHELSHIKRNDYLINLFISLIETILFFNPFVVLLARIIKRERENCCDDIVIQYQYDRYDYASALLSLEESRNVCLRLSIGATSGKKQLMLRIKRIMEINSNTNFNYGQKLLAMLLITVVFCSVAWLSPENKEGKKQEAKKIQEKVYDKKINSDEKSESFIVKPIDNKVQSITVRSRAKKEFPIMRKLQEFKDLNLKEIAITEFKRMNMLLQESKKEISDKKISKFNFSRLFIAQRLNTSSSFGKRMAMLPFKSEFSSASFDPQLAYSMNYQKLQANWNRAQFSFSFDCEEMQNAVEKIMNSKQLQSLMHLPQHMKDADIKKMIKDELQKASDRNIKDVPGKILPGIASITNNQSFYFDDESDPDVKIIKERTRSTGKNKLKSVEDNNMHEPNAYAYTYEVGNKNNENRTRRFFSSVINSPRERDEKPIPATPDVAPLVYRIIYNNVKPAKTNAPKPSVHVKENIRLEYKNGAVIVNGKKLLLTEVSELLNEVSLKVKKIHLGTKEFIEPQIEE
jgi:beta-lactamase regulating signal transducer with metallopeptidase domain